MFAGSKVGVDAPASTVKRGGSLRHAGNAQPRPTARLGLQPAGARAERRRPAGGSTGLASICSSLALRQLAQSPIDFAAVDEHHEAGDGRHFILRGETRLLVDVDLADRKALGRELLNDRLHLPARAAPIGAEVQQDRVRCARQG